MPATTAERQETAPATIRKRPVSGIAIDPDRLTWWRESRGWSRQDLSDRITALGLADDDGSPLTVTRDAIAKNETTGIQGRKPKARTVRAYCAALSTAAEPVTPRDLLPGGDPLDPHEDAVARRRRLEYNRELRAFAREHGIRYKNPVSGRVYYSVPLRDAHELAIMEASEAEVTAAVARAITAQETGHDEDGAQDDNPAAGLTAEDAIANLDLSPRTSSALDRDGIRTIGELTARGAAALQEIRNFGPASLAEVREQLGLAGFALAGETPDDRGQALLAS